MNNNLVLETMVLWKQTEIAILMKAQKSFLMMSCYKCDQIRELWYSTTYNLWTKTL